MPQEFEIDVAFSLLDEDKAFAQEIKKHLPSTINSFLYTDKAEALVGKNGVVEFAEVFKKRSRVVVVLHRKGWGESFYTEIEQDAILDRVKGSKGSLRFIIMIPLDGKENLPSWYPETKIYVNAKQDPKQIAELIQYKIVDNGGTVVEETVASILSRRKKENDEKTLITAYLESPDSIDDALNEAQGICTFFKNEKNVFKENGFRLQHGNVQQGRHSYYIFYKYLVLQFIFKQKYNNTSRDSVLIFELARRRHVTDIGSGSEVIELYKSITYRFDRSAGNIGWRELNGAHKFYLTESLFREWVLLFAKHFETEDNLTNQS